MARPKAPLQTSAAGADLISIEFSISAKDVDKALKKLNQWQGAPLATRAAKAEQVGMGFFVAPLKARATRHRLSGDTERGYRVTRLRPRTYEKVAYKVASNTPQRAYAVSGSPKPSRDRIRPDPYVDQVRVSLAPKVIRFVDEQIRRLA